jgi:hypothetical protein
LHSSAPASWPAASASAEDGLKTAPAAGLDAATGRPGQSYGYFIFEENYRTACGELPVWYMAGNGGSQILMLRELRAAIVITRTAFNVHGSSLQTADMLKKYILPALPCVKS